MSDPNSMTVEINADMSIEDLKKQQSILENINNTNMANLAKLNLMLIERIEKGPSVPNVTEKTRKIRLLIQELSKLIAQKMDLEKSSKITVESFQKPYYERRDELINSGNIGEKHESSTENSDLVGMERDKALGLVKVLLATLKSSRMQSEENFTKLKYSSDLMFHIMYKAEDAYLNQQDSAKK